MGGDRGGGGGGKPILRMILFICLAMAFMHCVNCCNDEENFFPDNTTCFEGEPLRTPEEYKKDLETVSGHIGENTKDNADTAKRCAPEWTNKCKSNQNYYAEEIGECVCGCRSPPCPVLPRTTTTPAPTTTSTTTTTSPTTGSSNPGPGNSDNPGPGGSSGSPTPNSSSSQVMVGLIVTVMVAGLNLG